MRVHLAEDLDMPAIAAEVCARIEGGKLSTDTRTRSVEGKWRGRSLKIECWRNRQSPGTGGWTVDVEVGGPPLWLRVCQKIVGEGALTERDVVTDDVDFDRGWTLEGAPAVTAKRLVDADLRRAIVALGKEIDAPVGLRLNRDDVDQPLGIEKGRVRTASQGVYSVAEIMAGIELAVCAADRVDALARERDANPPTPAQLTAERDAIARRDERFVTWATAKMGWPGWIALAILLVPNWAMTQVNGFPRRAAAIVLLVDLAAIVAVVFLWKTRGRAKSPG